MPHTKSYNTHSLSVRTTRGIACTSQPAYLRSEIQDHATSHTPLRGRRQKEKRGSRAYGRSRDLGKSRRRGGHFVLILTAHTPPRLPDLRPRPPPRSAPHSSSCDALCVAARCGVHPEPSHPIQLAHSALLLPPVPASTQGRRCRDLSSTPPEASARTIEARPRPVHAPVHAAPGGDAPLVARPQPHDHEPAAPISNAALGDTPQVARCRIR